MTGTPCAGVVAYDEDGNIIERYACEAHLFDPGTCPWQEAVYAERAERRARR